MNNNNNLGFNGLRLFRGGYGPRTRYRSRYIVPLFLILILLVGFLPLAIIPQVKANPATVGTSTTFNAVNFGWQRKGFYAEGLFWAFYYNGLNAGWEFSADGTTWDGAFTSIGECLDGPHFSVWFDGTYVHYARYELPYDLYYRRGTPNADGTITWCAAEQLVYEGLGGNEYTHPCIAVDTNGYAWIGVYYNKPTGDDFPVILKNANNDGTWALDFAYELSAVDSTYWRVTVVPLTYGKVYVVYCRRSQPPLGQLWDGDWDAGEESDLADYSMKSDYGFSAVAIGDNVHFVYTKVATEQIRHNERVWGVGWNAADVLVQDDVSSVVPALSADPSEGDLYCFWTNITTDHVYYKKYSSGVWDVGATDWIDESTDGIIYDHLISSFYMDYGGYIGLLYVTKLASPYNVRFAFLTMPPPPPTFERVFGPVPALLNELIVPLFGIVGLLIALKVADQIFDTGNIPDVMSVFGDLSQSTIIMIAVVIMLLILLAGINI